MSDVKVTPVEGFFRSVVMQDIPDNTTVLPGDPRLILREAKGNGG